jgi:predicted DNA-binding protein (MmcQ/YjbR family)
MSDVTPAVRARQELLQLALRYPDAHEDHPWGETVVKVKGKVFVFVGENEGRLSMTTKLPRSGPAALTLPFTAPCGYGLGKSGWVTARFDAGEDIPTDLLVAWVDESYRAVAPKRSVKVLEGALPAAAPARPATKASTPKAPASRAAKKKAAKKKAAKKKAAKKKAAKKKTAKKKTAKKKTAEKKAKAGSRARG